MVRQHSPQLYLGTEAERAAYIPPVGTYAKLFYTTDAALLWWWDGSIWQNFGSGGGGHIIQDHGSDMTARSHLDFTGAGVTVTDDAGNDATKIDISGGGGGGGSTALVGCAMATRTNTITINHNTVTPITFTAGDEVFDPDGMHSGTTNPENITIGVDGLYHITGSTSFDDTYPAQLEELWLEVNGNRWISGFAKGPSGLDAAVYGYGVSISIDMDLVAGDVLALKAYQNCGNPLFLYNYSFSVTKLDSGGAGGHVIQDEGTPLTSRANLNFAGAGVTVTDDSGNDASLVTIPGGSSIWINVMDHGATGDGITDDTAAVQDAIDTAHAVGGVVFLPSGTYLCDPLTTYTNVPLRGQGNLNTIIKARSSGALLSCLNPAYSAWTGEYIDFALEGDGVGTDGLSLSGISEFVMRRVLINNFTGIGLKFLGMIACSLYDCVSQYCDIGLSGDIGNSRYSNLNLFATCRFAGNSSYGVDWQKGGVVKFLTCDISANGGAANSNTGGIRYRPNADLPGVGLILSECWFDTNAGDFVIDIEEASISGYLSIIENCAFGFNTGKWGIIVVNNNRVLCLHDYFYTHQSIGDYVTYDSGAYILLDNSVGTTAGPGTIEIASFHAPVTISDTSSVDMHLTGQALSADVLPGGIKLDDFGTPDDNTDLNATITEHGLLRKLSGNSSEFLNGVGSWVISASGAREILQDSNGAILTDETGNILYVEVM